ncbi:MAG TPA: hypothetical protein DCS93_10220 [Microscillaceae bacterium]|nr:hypothetical protein [Microscillaceae bacterium]
MYYSHPPANLSYLGTFLLVFISVVGQTQTPFRPAQRYVSTQPNIKQLTFTKITTQSFTGHWHLYDGTTTQLTYRLVNADKLVYEATTQLLDISRLEFLGRERIVAYYLSGNDRKVLQIQILTPSPKTLQQATTQWPALQQWIGRYKVLKPTSKAHNLYVNQIKFFKDKPVIGSSIAKQAVPVAPQVFTPNKPLWAVVYLSQPLKMYKAFLDKNRVQFKAGVYTGLAYEPITWGAVLHSRPLTSAELENNYVVLPLLNTKSRETNEMRTNELLLRNLARLPTFGQQIGLKLHAPGKYQTNGRLPIQGSFRYKAGKYHKRLISKYKSLAKRRLKSVRLPLRHKTLPAIEQTVLEQLLKKSSTNAQNLPYTYQKVRLIEADWTLVHKDFSEEIKGREIKVAVVRKWDDGHCSYQINRVFQWYRNGAFESTLVVLPHGPVKDILCKRTKK